jgi:hypothetical protein
MVPGHPSRSVFSLFFVSARINKRHHHHHHSTNHVQQNISPTDNPMASRVLRAETAAGGLRLSLVALVHRTGQLSTGRPAFHFVGSPAGRLVDVRALRVGKKSVAATTGSSHYMRRAGQLQTHAASMQDLGVAVHVPETQRAHTQLLDAYISRAEHAGRPMLCVSVFA